MPVGIVSVQPNEWVRGGIIGEPYGNTRVVFRNTLHLPYKTGYALPLDCKEAMGIDRGDLL